jgi:hypothetical protein
MKTLLLLLLAIAVYSIHSVTDFVEKRSRNVPRKYPVYIDDQTVYLNQPIMYSEWEREISSSV